MALIYMTLKISSAKGAPSLEIPPGNFGVAYVAIVVLRNTMDKFPMSLSQLQLQLSGGMIRLKGWRRNYEMLMLQVVVLVAERVVDEVPPSSQASCTRAKGCIILRHKLRSLLCCSDKRDLTHYTPFPEVHA